MADERCPSHGGGDYVRKVSAVFGEQYFQGRSDRVVGAVMPHGWAVGRAVGVSVSASATAQALAPEPLVRRNAALPVIGAIPALLFGAVMCAASGGAVIGIPFVLLALIALARGAYLHALNAQVDSGRPGARAVWDRAWYCGRCELVFFARGQEPAGVPVDEALAPARFQELVWSAGGYGDRLAGRSPQRAAQTRQTGKTLLAVAGGLAVVVGGIVAVAVLLSRSGDGGPDPDAAFDSVVVPSFGQAVTAAQGVMAGECLNGVYATDSSGQLAVVDLASPAVHAVVVPCNRPHDAQVFGGFSDGEGDGAGALSDAEADVGVCNGEASRYYPAASADDQVTVIYDSGRYTPSGGLQDVSCLFEGTTPGGLSHIVLSR